jgi:hypothetical protein
LKFQIQETVKSPSLPLESVNNIHGSNSDTLVFKGDTLEQISAAKSLFQLISACSASVKGNEGSEIFG